MDKLILVQKLAIATDLIQADCKKVLEAFMDIVKETLKEHKNIRLAGFGTFCTMKKKTRTGVNPATGKKMIIPEHYVSKFRPNKCIRKLLNS